MYHFIWWKQHCVQAHTSGASSGLLFLFFKWFDLCCASAGLWQYQTFRHGPVLYILDCQLRAMPYIYKFRALWSFWWGRMQYVRLEWRTDWIDCEHSLFTPCSWLRRNVKKIIGSLCCIVGSALWLTKSRSLRTEDRGSNTELGIAKPVALFHHSHRIVESSWQSSPDISLKIASNMVSFEVLIISRINWWLIQLCVVC